jgi:hypothetical protein
MHPNMMMMAAHVPNVTANLKSLAPKFVLKAIPSLVNFIIVLISFLIFVFNNPLSVVILNYKQNLLKYNKNHKIL